MIWGLKIHGFTIIVNYYNIKIIVNPNTMPCLITDVSTKMRYEGFFCHLQCIFKQMSLYVGHVSWPVGQSWEAGSKRSTRLSWTSYTTTLLSVWDVYMCVCACMYACFYVFYGLDYQAKYMSYWKSRSQINPRSHTPGDLLEYSIRNVKYFLNVLV